MKLGAGLLATIAVACAVGTFIRQDGRVQPTDGPAGILSTLGLTDLYHSWWFLCLLSLLLVNVTVCVFSRMRWLIRRPGMLLVHSSAIFIAAGAVVGGIWGVKGFLALPEGGAADYFEVWRGNERKRVPLGFTIGLDDFILERYESASQGMVLVKERDREPVEAVPAEVGHIHRVFGGRYSVEVVRLVPDFRMDVATREIMSASDEFNNPAVQIKIVGDGKEETRWLFALYPEVHMRTAGLPLEAQFRFGGTGRIKDYKSKLWIEDRGARVLAKTIEVNDPLFYGGYHFYQSDYDKDHLSYTVLQVVRDPGVPLVYIGFAMLCLGTVVDLYPRGWRTTGLNSSHKKE